PPIPTSPPTTSAAGNPPPPIDPVERFRAIASAGSKFYGAGTYFGQDKEGAVAFLTALRRLALPDASPNPSYAQIATGELTNWVSRNPTFTDGDSLLQTYESWGAARQRPSPVNYTDLADLVQALTREEGIRNLNALASLGLTLGGTKLAERDPEAGTNMTRVGGAMGATGDAWLGARLLSDSAKYAAFLKAARTPLGGVASGLGALAGGFQLYHSTELLVTDPSIADIRSNERWGVGLQALGGGLLMVGGLAGAALAVGATGAIFSALPILIPIGLAVGAVGWAVKNWDWLGGGLKAWVGIGKNSRQIVKALPSYVNDTVIRPQLQKVKEKLIEPIIRGAEAWPGILDNGKKIVQALPRYVSESVVKPVVAAVQEKVIQPAAQWLSEKVMQPAANLNARVIQPTLKALNERVAQPINNAVNKTARFFKNLFGRGK
ncbi:MAG TPA: hypothetical protein VJ123_06935, partial [Anaerolineales bacterium]|nr:hypothetical protein [Anaerolineales bacterium]